MKPLPARGTYAALLLALGFLAAPLAADPPPAVAPAPTDPFVKKDAPPVDTTGPISNVILTFATYTLTQTDGSKLILENATDQARHDRVLELVKAGKAHLDSVTCNVLKSGEQTVLEQVDVVPYAISFNPGAPGKDVFPTDFKKRNVGLRVVFKGQITEDHLAFEGNLYYENTVLNGFANAKSNIGNATVDTSQPQFCDRRVNTKPPSFLFDQVRLLGTYSPMPNNSWLPEDSSPSGKTQDSDMTLVFGKATLMQIDPGTLKDVKPPQVELLMSLYSMDREQALQVLDQKQTMDSAYQAVQSLVKTNQAKLEHFTVLRTITGVKCNVDEVNELTYCTGGPDQFETQDVGFSEEVRPWFIGASPCLNLDITKCQWLKYLGTLRAPGVTPYNQTRPVFELQSIVTNLNAALGEHELLGTFTPPGDTGVNGQKDDGRVWLAFLQTTAVNP